MSLQLKKRRNGAGLNKGKRGGRKPFTPEQIQLIRMNLEAKGDRRELALFEVALSTMLRVSDLLSLTVDMVLDHENAPVDEFTRDQKKTGKPITASLEPRAKAALLAYLFEPDGTLERARSSCVWTQGCRTLKRLRYSRIVKEWAKLAHLDPKHYSTHSLRKTQAAYLYKVTNNIEAVKQILGHGSVATTSKYLNLGVADALELKRKHAL
jgi:site-specific recombinase XerD